MITKQYVVQRNKFTLIELLASLAIIGVLLGVALPAFTKLAKGQGVELAARTIGAKLKASRAYAITKRKYVAVLFPIKHADLGSSSTDKNNVYPCAATDFDKRALPEKYYSQSYRVCVVNNAGGAYSFQRWIDGEKWEFLPEGTAILEVDNDPDVHENPGGTALQPENDGALRTITGPVDCSEIGGEPDATNFVGIVFKPNGRSPGSYVNIGEGKFSGGELVLTNKALKSYLTLNVDDITGRVSYETP